MADLRFTEGDTNVYSLTVIRGNTPVDLTNSTVWFTAKNDLADADIDAVIQLNSTDNPTQMLFIQPLLGTFQVILHPNDTENLAQTALYYDVQVVEASGVVNTVANGILRVVKEVTKSVA